MYEFYCTDFCQPRNIKPMSCATFDTALEEKNISLFQPKKDACDICTAFKTGNLAEKETHDQMKKKQEWKKNMTSYLKMRCSLWTFNQYFFVPNQMCHPYIIKPN